MRSFGWILPRLAAMYAHTVGRRISVWFHGNSRTSRIWGWGSERKLWRSMQIRRGIKYLYFMYPHDLEGLESTTLLWRHSWTDGIHKCLMKMVEVNAKDSFPRSPRSRTFFSEKINHSEKLSTIEPLPMARSDIYCRGFLHLVRW